MIFNKELLFHDRKFNKFIIDETLEYKSLLATLDTMRSSDGKLRKLLVTNCTVTSCPKRWDVKGLTNSCYIYGNIWVGKDVIPKKTTWIDGLKKFFCIK